jgi:TolB-like protein
MAPAARKMRRKLAAILMADIVGYSRLTGLDEPGTLTRFKQHLKTFIRPAIRRGRGRLVKTLGDGLLAEFDSPVNAVECALAIQTGAAEWNRSKVADHQIRYRIGINLGDIVFEDGDILGDGVNVAARLQTLSETNGIVVSQTVAQHITGKLEVAFEDMGEQKLKNIREPVRVYRVHPATNTSDQPLRRHVHTETPTIGVLPLANMSKDPEQSYFSDGIAEDLITELSRFRTISVVSRTASFRYRDTTVDMQKIADELGAQFLVEGSVRKAEQRLRITLQLIHAQSRKHVWAEKYDVELSDLFTVQDDVTRRVVAAIVPKMEAEELEIARKRPTAHMRAYDCYLRGKAMYQAATSSHGKIDARPLFEEAVGIDPEFARPYCYLAAIDNLRAVTLAPGASTTVLRDQARQYALKAASLDDSDPLTHLSLSWSHLWRHEFDAARKHLDIATRLNPNDSDRAVDRGTTLMYLGEPEAAVEIILNAIRLNPFHPDAYLVDLAEAYFAAHRYEDMLRVAEQVSDSSAIFMAWKAAACAYAGRTENARQLATQFVEGVRAIWAGKRDAGPTEYVEWLLSFSPFRRPEDTEHLVQGLKLAGLEIRRGGERR